MLASWQSARRNLEVIAILSLLFFYSNFFFDVHYLIGLGVCVWECVIYDVVGFIFLRGLGPIGERRWGGE
jgi:hypothetical protein